jgi:hypothetical protein
MKCPKCGGEIDPELEDAAIIVLSSPYIRTQDDDRKRDRVPGDKLDALLWYARFLAEQVIHKCGHEEKVK